MPNINFDIFYDTDTINFTASRGTNAPKAKPSWKIRQAPKLPPREPPQPAAAKAFGPKSVAPQSSTPTKPATSSAAGKSASTSKPNSGAATSGTPKSEENEAAAVKPKRKAKKLEIRNKKPASTDSEVGTPSSTA